MPLAYHFAIIVISTDACSVGGYYISGNDCPGYLTDSFLRNWGNMYASVDLEQMIYGYDRRLCEFNTINIVIISSCLLILDVILLLYILYICMYDGFFSYV